MLNLRILRSIRDHVHIYTLPGLLPYFFPLQVQFQ
jgi:hypothetical protein